MSAPAPPLLARELPADELAAALFELARRGYAVLPGLLCPTSAALLAERARALMAGELGPKRWFFQHDSPTGSYRDLVYGAGFVGPSQAYRKVEGLERDAWFRAWIEHPVLEPLVRGAVPDAQRGPVALARAVLWNKAAGGGTELPWHQDGGRFWGLDRQPELQLWTALDDASVEAGCVELVPGTHQGGLATPEGGTIPDELTASRVRELVHVPARRGDVVLLHNLVWHRSGVNRTSSPRRALSVCYMSAATRCTRKRDPRRFPLLFAAPIAAGD